MTKRKLEETLEPEEIETNDENLKKIKNDGEWNIKKLIWQTFSQYSSITVEKTEHMEQDEEDAHEDGEAFDSTLNFDIKRFRQNLKAGNFNDGE